MLRFIGLDLHRDYVHGCEIRGKEKRHFRFPNTPEAWLKFAATMDGDAHVALEVTGNAYKVHDLLSPLCGKVLLVNTHAALRKTGSGRKTDRVDAELMAQKLMLGLLEEVWVPPVAIRELRTLLGYYDQLVRKTVVFQNQIRAVVRRNGIKVAMRRLLSPAGRCELERLDLPLADRLAVASAMAMYDAIQQEAARIEREIAHRVQENPGVKLLMSITGVGLLTAAVVYAWVGDPSRFKGAKQIARYAGLDPSVIQSGEVDWVGRISKNGSCLLRHFLVQAAQIIARADQGPLGQYFRGLASRKCRNKAVIALARKLLVVMWKMLSTGELYRGYKEHLYRNKLRTLTKSAKPYFEPNLDQQLVPTISKTA